MLGNSKHHPGNLPVKGTWVVVKSKFPGRPGRDQNGKCVEGETQRSGPGKSQDGKIKRSGVVHDDLATQIRDIPLIYPVRQRSLSRPRIMYTHRKALNRSNRPGVGMQGHRNGRQAGGGPCIQGQHPPGKGNLYQTRVRADGIDGADIPSHVTIELDAARRAGHQIHRLKRT